MFVEVTGLAVRECWAGHHVGFAGLPYQAAGRRLQVAPHAAVADRVLRDDVGQAETFLLRCQVAEVPAWRHVATVNLDVRATVVVLQGGAGGCRQRRLFEEIAFARQLTRLVHRLRGQVFG